MGRTLRSISKQIPLAHHSSPFTHHLRSHHSSLSTFPDDSGILRIMAIELEQTARGAILYDSTRVGKPSDELFQEAHWMEEHKIVARARGRGGVIFIRDE